MLITYFTSIYKRSIFVCKLYIPVSVRVWSISMMMFDQQEVTKYVYENTYSKKTFLPVFVRKMLDQGLITEEEYCRIDTKNRAKFQPVTGTLLSGKSLLFKENRGNMLAGKEAQSFENGNKD